MCNAGAWVSKHLEHDLAVCCIDVCAVDINLDAGIEDRQLNVITIVVPSIVKNLCERLIIDHQSESIHICFFL